MKKVMIIFSLALLVSSAVSASGGESSEGQSRGSQKSSLGEQVKNYLRPVGLSITGGVFLGVNGALNERLLLGTGCVVDRYAGKVPFAGKYVVQANGYVKPYARELGFAAAVLNPCEKLAGYRGHVNRFLGLSKTSQKSEAKFGLLALATGMATQGFISELASHVLNSACGAK